MTADRDVGKRGRCRTSACLPWQTVSAVPDTPRLRGLGHSGIPPTQSWITRGPMFKGRFNRATYWALMGLALVLTALLIAVTGADLRVPEYVWALLCIPRLHDIGKSGWFFLIAIAVEIFGTVVSLSMLSGDAVVVGLGITALLVVAPMVLLGLIPGDPQANRYGPPPLPGVAFRAKSKRTVADTFD